MSHIERGEFNDLSFTRELEVKIVVERDPVKTFFEKWAKLGHFSKTLAKGLDTTTWIWKIY
jgi:photosystem I P700 chlorophyll a apoprotein A1